MKSFSDFGIKVAQDYFVGDKVKISKILNKSIVVHGYKIEPSKYPKNKSGNVLVLQIETDEKQVVFTGSEFLMDQITQVAESSFPFKATIVKSGEHFEFK